MRIKVRWVLLAGLLMSAGDVLAQDTNFFIFLCFGQSNSEGFPGIEPQDKAPVDERFQVLAAVDFPSLDRTKGNWYPAIPPLCRPSAGLCPADYFGRTLVSNLPPSIKVGIVNVSVAGCKIELFDKGNFQTYAAKAPGWMTNIINTYGGNPYQHLVGMAKLAQKDGVIKGILLHQGESNTNDKEWPNKVKAIYDNLIKDLNLKADEVPLLAGELVSADQKGACASMNSIIDDLPKTIPNSYVISSQGCTSRPDHLHFNPAGYRELGKRYGERMLSLLGYQPRAFISYFLPTSPHGELVRETWGATNVLPRDTQNGLEDTTMTQYCYWDGQIIKAPDGKYHLFASRWDEARGHNGWFGSVAVHAVSESLTGPYQDQGLCWPNDQGGKAHNVTALTLPDGRYAIVISETRPCEVYVSKSLDGPWEHLGTVTVEGEPKWHASNVAIMARPDGNFEFVPRDGRIFFSDKGILGPYQPQGNSVFPRGIPNLEDPCIWYSGGLYHIVVNSWSTRKAYHLTSRDGLHDWTNRGVAYDPREAIVRYPDGTVNHWNKAERPSVYIENGHVAAMTLAVIDVEKEQDKGNDGHGSKVIVIPFDGAALDRDLQSAADSPTSASGVDGATFEPRAPIPYSTVQVINEDDSAAAIAEKAAKVLPRANQTAWMRLERTFFLHFGVNTFNEVEWGSGREEPSLFNPTELDANQWLSAITNFGGKMIVLVSKHHDGFCMWPTRYTPHSTVASPWRGGKGDLVREVAEAARAHGVKLAVYLSPADLYQLRTNPKNPAGYYGNGSSNVLSVIPTDPASFQSNPAKGRTPPAGFTNYTYVVDDYNRYFLNQLYELLTEYGPIAEVWFDGANPDPSVHETYHYAAWYHLIRSLQPNAVIMGKGPDVRWVGNEGGVGRTTEWSVIPLPTSPETFNWPDMTAGDLGSRAKLKPGSHLWWFPAEVNTTVLANSQWFWARNKHPRTVTQLVDIYYTSIGRNGNLILNLSPDKRGLVPENQLDALSRTAEIINETFATDLAAGGTLTADYANATNGAPLALDGNLDTWWEAAPGKTNGTVTLTLPKAVTFDVVSLQEAVDHRGQRIESFVIETWTGAAWATAQKVASDELTTVGHRRLIRLKSPVTTDQVRIRINGSRLEPTLAEMGLFKQSVKTLPPIISDRSTNGTVTLSNAAGNKMVYTVDGSVPTTDSTIYALPIALPLNRSVTVRTASLLPNGQLGIAGSRIFAGLMPIGWKVVSVDSEETAGADNAAARAIDGDSSTFWHTRWNADQKLPHSITVDMGATHRVGGFTYLPRQDGMLNGTVEKFRFETSEDGANWVTNIAEGAFANIQNNPSLQEVSFAPAQARYFRFTALQSVWRSGWTSAAEISVLPADKSGN